MIFEGTKNQFFFGLELTRAGFEIPKEILADPRCDLALALEIFYLSDGYAYLEDLEKTTDLKEWNSFITALVC